MFSKFLISLFLISLGFNAISNEKNKTTVKKLETNVKVVKLDNANKKLKQEIDKISKNGTDEMIEDDGSTIEQNRKDPAVQNAIPGPNEKCAKGIIEKFILDPMLDLIFGKDERNEMWREEAEAITGNPNSCPEEVNKKRRELANLATDGVINPGPTWYERFGNKIIGFFTK